MNEVIRLGIEKANQDLKQEHDKIMMQEVNFLKFDNNKFNILIYKLLKLKKVINL
jgi:hypothetical protein